MKMIQSIYDIEKLKRSKDVPIELVQEIEDEFLYIYESVDVNV